MKDVGPLPLRSSSVGIGRVASTISMLQEASFSLEGSLGAVGGKVVSWATSLAMSAAFSTTSYCFASLGGGDVNCRKSFCWTFLAKKAVSTLELEEPGAPMAGGQYALSAHLRAKEASTPAQSRASFHTWRQQNLHTSETSTLKASSVSTTPMSNPSCSACSLAFSASSNFFVKTLIWLLAMESSSSTQRSCLH